MNIIKPRTRHKLTVHACGIETRFLPSLCVQGGISSPTREEQCDRGAVKKNGFRTEK